MIFTDTESIGFYGPMVTIQWSTKERLLASKGQDVSIHYVWDSTVRATLDLIESIVAQGILGFHLTHDWFQLSKTYNVLSQLPLSKPPAPLDYLDVEDEQISHDKYCLKPNSALDLLLIGRRTKFQIAMGQKTVKLRKVPRLLASWLKDYLETTLSLDSILFAKSKAKCANWKILPLHRSTCEPITPEEASKYRKGQLELEVHPDLVDIHLKFSPSTSLKSIGEHLGIPVTHYGDLGDLPKVTEWAYWPGAGRWIDVFKEYIFEWRNNPRRIAYAKQDVTLLYYVWLDLLNDPLAKVVLDSGNDPDSELACAVGGMHWKGFTIDTSRAKELIVENKKVTEQCPINWDSPKQVVNWLQEKCTPLERRAVNSSNAKLMQQIAADWEKDNPEVSRRAKTILDVRRADDELTLLERLISAGRMYAVYKVSGTKSNRMAGGSIVKSNGSINPQGIKKSPRIRSVFTLANLYDVDDLGGGDFSGFEVSIAEAVYQDPTLRAELLTGKKIHALFGAAMYNKSYEEILATSELNINDPNGYYQRAKRGFFALLYGAEKDKLAESMWLTTEQAAAGVANFYKKYVVIGKNKERLKKLFTPMEQHGKGNVTWVEPQQYVESILGYRRYFTVEWKVAKALWALASDPPEDLINLGRQFKVFRRSGREQTGTGALISALYSCAFGISNGVLRAAGNHEIQSPGGQLTKELQCRIWDVQPKGISSWVVMPMNVHDEVECPTNKNYANAVTKIVNDFIQEKKKIVPLIAMSWHTGLNNWGEKE